MKTIIAYAIFIPIWTLIWFKLIESYLFVQFVLFVAWIIVIGQFAKRLEW